MEVRRLDPREFDLLEQGPHGAPDPLFTMAVGALEGGDLVGHIYLVALPHVEAPWIKEGHRGGTLLKRMEKELIEMSKEYGIDRVFAFAADDEKADYLKRLGYKKSNLTVWERE